MKRISVVIMAFAPLFAQPVLADSDGYFCTGKGYIAFETSFSWPENTHRLRVVRFGSDIGIVESEPLVLEDFQTHGMRCEEGRIELLGWEFKYIVDASDLARPMMKKKIKPSKPGEPLPGFASRNLGNSAKPGVVRLSSNDARFQFELVIARTARTFDAGVEDYTVSALVQRGGLTILKSVVLFAGFRPRPTGE